MQRLVIASIDGHIFTEEDWTEVNIPLPAYIKSKTVAEKAAWDFVANEGKGLALTVINPVGIFGPSMGGITSASLDIAITGILNGTTKQSGDFTMGVVDVRDVADIHIKAMTHPEAAGERFLANADGVMSFYDVAELIRKERPSISENISKMQATSAAFIKREELLLILLKSQPDLANIFFSFGIAHKMDLEIYMNRNFRFNVSLERFAYLTGRSLSSFKRDFKKPLALHQANGSRKNDWMRPISKFLMNA